MKIRAPAKVNLCLRVVGKRKDGYHLIDTIMIPVSLYDDIIITCPKKRAGAGTASASLKVTCDHPWVPGGRKNLAYQAAALLLRKSRIRLPVSIHIRKRIPVGGGLGGGSSDAAAVLVGLNRLLRLGVRSEKLRSLAASLGADLPFFIHGRPARARGIGDRLSTVRAAGKLWMVILYPGFPVSTRWVYGHYRSKLTKSIENTSISFSWGKRKKLTSLLVNDLEQVTVRRYPRIALLKERLVQEGAEGALMSGSGSSVFGVFATRYRAAKAFRRLRRERGIEAFLVRMLS